jgi:DNA-binding transcriptional MerR regulator
MTLKLIVDALDGVDAKFHDLYAKADDGKFRLKVDGIEDTSGLKSALEKERAAAKEAKAFKALGLTPEEIAELKAARDKGEEEAAKKAGDFESLRKKMTEQFEAKERGYLSQIATLSQSEHSAVVSAGLTSALVASGATKEGVELLSTLLKDRAKIETVDGKRVVKIFDADGTPMLVNGKDATFADLATASAGKYPQLFAATTKAGSGTQPNGAGRAATKTIKRSELIALAPAEASKLALSGVQVID